MLKHFLAALFVFTLVGPAFAAKLQNENLLTPVPSGFKVGYAADNGKTTMMELIPKAESVEDWSRMVTSRTDRNLHVDPDVYAKTLGKGWKASCPGGEITKVRSGMERGYPFALWLYICPLNPQTGKPETMTLKAIRGKDAFYQVQYAFRRDADADVATTEGSYLSGVLVCDTRKPDQACPAGM